MCRQAIWRMVLQVLRLRCRLDVQEVMSHRGLDNLAEFGGEVWAGDMNVGVVRQFGSQETGWYLLGVADRREMRPEDLTQEPSND